jgi:Uma2 family endonuclease
MELVYGIVREPPAPRYGHQSVVTHLGALLDAHVRRFGLGAVCVAPIDVVLDAAAALVVQPDIVFVSAARRDLIRERIWGSPDLVVEVLSPGTARRDRTVKLAWYRRYGVRECWLIDPQNQSVAVVDLQGARKRRRTFSGSLRIQSHVLTDWTVAVRQIFE